MMNRTHLAVPLLAGFLLAAGSLLSPPARAAEPATVNFVYDWPNADFELVPITVAQEKGFYAQQGLKVHVAFPPNSQTTAQMLVTGRGDIGFEATTDVIFAAAHDIPVISIAFYSQSNNWGLIGRPGEKVSLDDLRGKSIAIFTDSWTKAMMPFVLKAAQLNENDVRLIIAQDDDITLLLAKKIDIATNTSNYALPEVVDAVHKQPTMLIGKDAAVPDVPIWCYTSSHAWLKAHPELATKWLAATRQGMEWATAHPDAAAALFTKAYPQAGTLSYNQLGWKATVPLLKGPDGYMTQSGAQWLGIAQALQTTGQIKEVLKPSVYYTNEYLK